MAVSAHPVNGAVCSDDFLFDKKKLYHTIAGYISTSLMSVLCCGNLKRWPSQWLPLGTAALGSSQDIAEPTTLLAERESGAMLVI